MNCMGGTGRHEGRRRGLEAKDGHEGNVGERIEARKREWML